MMALMRWREFEVEEVDIRLLARCRSHHHHRRMMALSSSSHATAASSYSSSSSLSSPTRAVAEEAEAVAVAVAGAGAGDVDGALPPPHCVPIRADVRSFDFESLGAVAQFDVIVLDPPWQLATNTPSRGVRATAVAPACERERFGSQSYLDLDRWHWHTSSCTTATS